jgi:hypothetical protein
MWDAIILGNVPGTNIFISYTVTMLLIELLLLLVLARSIMRRRSSLYWRTYAEVMLRGVENELYPTTTALGENFENPFIAAKLQNYRKNLNESTATATAKYAHRIGAAVQAGITFRQADRSDPEARQGA